MTPKLCGLLMLSGKGWQPPLPFLSFASSGILGWGNEPLRRGDDAAWYMQGAGMCCLAQANPLPSPSLSRAIIPASCQAAALAPVLGLEPVTPWPPLVQLMQWHHPGSPLQPRGAPSALHEHQAVST